MAYSLSYFPITFPYSVSVRKGISLKETFEEKKEGYVLKNHPK